MATINSINANQLLGTGATPTFAGLATTGSISSTGSRATKVWATDIESTNMPTVGGVSLSATFAPISTTGISWSVVTGTTQAASVNSGYATNNAALVTVTLPATAAVGSRIRISGMGAGGWLLAQNALQLIHFGTSVTTTGTGGSLASTAQYDTLEILCLVADTEFVVLSSVGNITVV
jgi:hypothetical protein